MNDQIGEMGEMPSGDVFAMKVIEVAGRVGTAATDAGMQVLRDLGFGSPERAIEALRANVDLVRSLSESIEKRGEMTIMTRAILQMSASNSRVLMAFLMGLNQANDELPEPDEWREGDGV